MNAVGSRRRLLGAAAAGGAGAGLTGFAVACGPGSAGPAPGAEVTKRAARIAVTYHTTSAVEQNQLAAHVVQSFRERYPNVEVEEITAGGPAINEKVLALVASGTPPDVLNLSYGGAGGADDLAARGALLKLDDRLKRDRAFKWEDFWPGARLAGQFEGSQAALPNGGVNAALMYFSKELFAAAGRPTPDQLHQRQAWTWETLVEEAPRLTKREPTGELDQAGLGYPWEPWTWTIILLRSYGADYMNKEGTKVVIDSPQAVQALRVAYELGPRRRTMPLRGEGNSVDLVKAGRVAQAVYWFTAASWWRPTPFDWDVAPTPAGPAGSPTRGGVGLLAVARETKEPDVAWAYCTFVLSPEMDVERASTSGAVVLRQSAMPAWRERMAAQKPRNLNLIEATVRSLSLEPLRRPHPRLPEVDAILNREIAALLLDGEPPEQMAKTLATEGNALLG
jgi:multiple sugar transport system substrate-binding protein